MLSEKLFPNSPIEVQQEGDQYVVYLEGEWHSDWPTLDDASDEVEEIIFRYSDDWPTPACRVNPSWVGWPKISLYSLILISRSLNAG